jgi:hypothetical protein
MEYMKKSCHGGVIAVDGGGEGWERKKESRIGVEGGA